jgi:hypothetical protein
MSAMEKSDLPEVARKRANKAASAAAEPGEQPGNVNYSIAIIIVAILVAFGGMVCGPIGAFLGDTAPLAPLGPASA